MGEIREGDQKYTYLDDHRVIHGTFESLFCTPATNVVVHVNHTEIEILNIFKKMMFQRSLSRKDNWSIGNCVLKHLLGCNIIWLFIDTSPEAKTTFIIKSLDNV